MNSLWYEALFIYWRIVCVVYVVLHVYTQYLYQSDETGGDL